MDWLSGARLSAGPLYQHRNKEATRNTNRLFSKGQVSPWQPATSHPVLALFCKSYLLSTVFHEQSFFFLQIVFWIVRLYSLGPAKPLLQLLFIVILLTNNPFRGPSIRLQKLTSEEKCNICIISRMHNKASRAYCMSEMPQGVSHFGFKHPFWVSRGIQVDVFSSPTRCFFLNNSR